MNAQELLTDLERAGVRMAREGEQLVITGLANYLTPAVRMEIKRLKPQLLALLPDTSPREIPSAPVMAPGRPWWEELPVTLNDWAEFCARHGGLPGVRLFWPEGAPGLVAILPEEA